MCLLCTVRWEADRFGSSVVVAVTGEAFLSDNEVDRPMDEIIPGSRKEDEIEFLRNGFLLRRRGDVGGEGSFEA